MTTAQLFPFTVEVKLRESWSLKNVLAGKKSPIWGWYLQAIKAAEEQKNIPLLIFRKNRYPWRIMIPEREYTRVTNAKQEIVWNEPIKGIPIDYHPVLILASDFLKDGPIV